MIPRLQGAYARAAGSGLYSGNLLVGRGIAYMRYKQNENYVAMAMEVAVDPATGVNRPADRAGKARPG